MSNIEKVHNSKENIKDNIFFKKATMLFFDYLKKDINNTTDLRIELQKVFDLELENLFSKVDTSKINSIKIEKDRLFINLKNKSLVFDLSKTEKFYIGEKKELEKLDKKIPELITQASDHLYLMDRIFYKNSQEWFGELDEEDVLSKKEINHFISSGYKVEGLKKYNSEKVDLKLLQKEFGLIYSDIKKIDKSKLSKEQKDEIISLEKKYLEIIMGIGDNYEGAVGFLSRKEEESKRLSESIVNYGTIEESLDYFNWIMTQIDDNAYQSTDVEHSYKLLFEKFTKGIFERIKRENQPLSVITTFVKMLRGDGYDIDDSLRTAGFTYMFGKYDFANEVIIYGMEKKGGIFDKVKKSGIFDFEDEKIKDKSPSSIIDKLSIQLDNSGDLLKNSVLNNSIYKDLISSKEKQYSELTDIQKSKLSVLYRLSEKIMEEPDKNKTINDLSDSLKEISKDFLEESSEKFQEMIDGGYNIFDKDFYTGSIGEKFGLTKDENKLFEQFKDLNGVGLFDISDNTEEAFKGIGKFAVMIGTAVGAPALLAPTATMMVQGAIAGFFASATSNVIMGKGFNTKEEAGIYIASDLALSTGLGAFSGRFLFDQNSNFAKWLSAKIPKDVYKNLLIQGIDLAILGLGVEFLRTMWFENKYYSESIFSEENSLDGKNKEKES